MFFLLECGNDIRIVRWGIQTASTVCDSSTVFCDSSTISKVYCESSTASIVYDNSTVLCDGSTV